MTTSAYPPYKQLRRTSQDRIVAGVCGGIARYFDVDPVLVRVLFAIGVVLTGGLGLLAYPILWFLMPEEAGPEQGTWQQGAWQQATRPGWQQPSQPGPTWPPATSYGGYPTNPTTPPAQPAPPAQQPTQPPTGADSDKPADPDKPTSTPPAA